MQLILVDKCEAHFTAANNHDYFDYTNQYYYDQYENYNMAHDYSTIQEVVIRHYESSHRELVDDFVAQITAKGPEKIGTLKTSLMFSSGSRGRRVLLYDITVSYGSTGFNILKELKERFQDMVTISVTVKCTAQQFRGYGLGDDPGNGNAILLSATEMAINAEGNASTKASVPVQNSHVLQYGVLHLQVTAYVPDDVLIPKVDEVTMLDKNKKILEEGLFGDVIITTENGVEVKGHKCFLVAASSVFQKMFGSKMQEAKTGNVDMTDMSEEGVKAFLRYIYFNDRIELEENISVAFDLLYAAHKYDIPGLESLMTSHLLKRQNEDFGVKWAFKTYMFVRGIESASPLKAKVVHILQKQFDELKALPEYYELFKKNPRDAMELCESFAKAPTRI